jgi:hypothetical protein
MADDVGLVANHVAAILEHQGAGTTTPEGLQSPGATSVFVV